MDIRKREQLENIIDTLGKFSRKFAIQKREMLEKYNNMRDEDIMDDLIISIYFNIGEDSAYYDYALSVIRNYEYVTLPPIDEIKSNISQSLQNNVRK